MLNAFTRNSLLMFPALSGGLEVHRPWAMCVVVLAVGKGVRYRFRRWGSWGESIPRKFDLDSTMLPRG